MSTIIKKNKSIKLDKSETSAVNTEEKIRSSQNPESAVVDSDVEKKKEMTEFSTISLVCGVMACTTCFLGPLFAIPGIIYGIRHFRYHSKKHPGEPIPGKYYALSGIILSVLAGVIITAGIGYQIQKSSLLKEKNQENMRMLTQAITQYEKENGKLPFSDKHSWRVLILPYLGEKELYDKIHLDESWSSGRNKLLRDQMPEIYRNPLEEKLLMPGETTYILKTEPDSKTWLVEEGNVNFWMDAEEEK